MINCNWLRVGILISALSLLGAILLALTARTSLLPVVLWSQTALLMSLASPSLLLTLAVLPGSRRRLERCRH